MFKDSRRTELKLTCKVVFFFKRGTWRGSREGFHNEEEIRPSHLPQQVCMTLNQLCVLLLQFGVALLVGLSFFWLETDDRVRDSD